MIVFCRRPFSVQFKFAVAPYVRQICFKGGVEFETHKVTTHQDEYGLNNPLLYLREKGT